jgi:hypothetical protein
MKSNKKLFRVLAQEQFSIIFRASGVSKLRQIEMGAGW